MISTGTHTPVFCPFEVIKVCKSLLHWKGRGSIEFF